MKNAVFFLIACLSSLSLSAQEITYSDRDRDGLVYGYDIIGKSGDNLLVYRKISYKHLISIYDNNLKLKDNIKLDFLPSNLLNLDFVNCGKYVFVIYQFQKRKVFYCMAAAVDGNGKIIKQPFQLDTTHIKFIADLQLYHIASSEDKSKIIVYKIYKGDVFTGDGLYDFTTLLFNDSLQLIYRSQEHTIFETDNDLFSDFLVDNYGTFVFTKALSYIQLIFSTG